jgi:hypothetical protein
MPSEQPVRIARRKLAATQSIGSVNHFGTRKFAGSWRNGIAVPGSFCECSCERNLLPASPALLLPLCFRKLKLMSLHIDARPVKNYSLHAEPKLLFRRIFSSQLDCAARADHAMPGQSSNLLQNAYNLTRRPRPPRRVRYGPIARHRSRRQPAKATQYSKAFRFRRSLFTLLNFSFHRSATVQKLLPL